MTLADMQKLSATAKEAGVKRKPRSTGPRTSDGKAISALNAVVKHGLSARHALLPGESVEDYVRRADGVFEALDPQNDAQAEIVALVSDDIHKLNRLERMERGILLGRIEELLAQTELAEKASRTARAVKALGEALISWMQAPLPVERNAEFERRVQALNAAFIIVFDMLPDLSPDHYIQCSLFLTRLSDAVAYPNFPSEFQASAYQAAFALFELIRNRAKAEESQQEELRTAIATISLPEKTELAKLARYRKLIEEGLARRLAALEQLRKLTASSTIAADGRKEKAREYRVKLRVVASGATTRPQESETELCPDGGVV